MIFLLSIHNIHLIQLISRLEQVLIHKDLLSSSLYLRTPENTMPTGFPVEKIYDLNITNLMPYIKSNLSELIHISVGRSLSTRIGNIQQCITYNPPGPSLVGVTPANTVCEYTYRFYCFHCRISTIILKIIKILPSTFFTLLFSCKW